MWLQQKSAENQRESLNTLVQSYLTLELMLIVPFSTEDKSQMSVGFFLPSVKGLLQSGIGATSGDFWASSPNYFTNYY